LGGIVGYVTGALALTLKECSNTGVVSADVSDTATEDAYVGGLVGGVASTTKLHLEDVVAAGAVSATVAEGRTTKVGAFAGDAFAYNAETQVGLWLTGRALTTLPQFSEALATVGGYTATKVEGDYTVYYVSAAPEPVVPGTSVDVPAGKTQQQFIDDLNTNDTYKAEYLIAPNFTTETTTAEYRNCFVAVAKGEKVEFALSAEGEETLKEIADEAVAGALEGVSLTVAMAIPGFFYSLNTAAALEDMAIEQTQQADGVKAVTFTLDKSSDAGFYQIQVDVANPVP